MSAPPNPTPNARDMAASRTLHEQYINRVGDGVTAADLEWILNESSQGPMGATHTAAASPNWPPRSSTNPNELIDITRDAVSGRGGTAQLPSGWRDSHKPLNIQPPHGTLPSNGGECGLAAPQQGEPTHYRQVVPNLENATTVDQMLAANCQPQRGQPLQPTQTIPYLGQQQSPWQAKPATIKQLSTESQQGLDTNKMTDRNAYLLTPQALTSQDTPGEHNKIESPEFEESLLRVPGIPWPVV